MIICKFLIIFFFICFNFFFKTIISKKEKKNIIPYPPTNQNTNPYYSKDLNNKLLFMRHGQTDFNADKSFSRKMNPIYVDCRINKKGISQAKLKQNVLNEFSFEKVYVSPFYRALQTLTYSLENHPKKDNIIAVVHPFVSEIGNSINDYLLDIKQTKKDFNLNSKIKIDWSLFDKYIKQIKYDENFFYFENFDCFDKNEKNKKYLELKKYYDNGEIEKLKKGLSDLAILRFNKYKISFESLKNAQGRFKKFLEYIREKHKDTLENKNEKIIVYSHGSFMKLATNRTSYNSEKIQNFHSNSYGPKNCEILSYNLYS